MDTLSEADPDSNRKVRTHLRDVAIAEFGKHGFEIDLEAIATAAGIGLDLAVYLAGSARELRQVCDDHILESVRSAKSEALQSMSPDIWFRQLAAIDDYAPMMNYLVRSMLAGGKPGRTLMHRMIENADTYLQDAVTMGSVLPSRDPEGRARLLALNNAGGFLMYLHMHETPYDMAAVLRDYERDMILPALELYTFGLLNGTAMYEAFLERNER